MAGKGKFSGFAWHHEFHTVDPKHNKAADCIYLDESRICRNRNCFKNGEKCFVATHCKYRVREGASIPQDQAPVEWRCSLPKGCYLFHKTYGVGEYAGCDSRNKLISVLFDDKLRSFKYPEAFTQGLLYGNQDVTNCVNADKEK